MSILKDKGYLLDPLIENKEYADVLDHIKKRRMPVTVTGPSESQKLHMASALCAHLGQKGMFIAYNEMLARKMFEDFSFFWGRDVLFFSSKEIMLHDVEAKSYDSVYERIEALYRITCGDYKFIVTSAEAVCQKLVDRKLFIESIIEISLGERIDLESVLEKLVSIGYERVTAVEGKGQFALRGGIIDIFPVNSDTAVRIELFDDEIDSIRSFDILTQRSVDKLDETKVLPARELIYLKDKRNGILESILRDLNNHIDEIKSKNSSDYVQAIEARIKADIERFEQEYYFPGMDRYIPYVVSKPEMLTDYTREDILVFIDEPKRFGQRLENMYLENQEMCKSLLEKGHLLPGSFQMYFDYDYVWDMLSRKKPLYFSAIVSDEDVVKSSYRIGITSKLLNSYQGHLDLLMEDISYWKKNRARIVVLSGTRSRGEMLAETLRSKNIEAYYFHDFTGQIEQGQVIITHGSLNRGFEYQEIGFVVVSGKELFGQDKKLRKTSKSKGKGQKISVFTDLNIGDLVVHQLHGIGRYVGIEQLVVDNVKKDYLKIKYHDGDFLYIPTNQLDLIQKYIGSEGKAPKLSRLGGTEWLKTKAKAKESLRELAEELIKLYAKRESVKGHSYPADTVWQKQFEEMFPYQETDDQIKCIEEIKKDMESDKPMDRLLCGDVGYGKTEVALRAIFKAVMDGKQVAYLVPTTVLAQQHYNNFLERMKDFPITVDMISRFRTQAEQKKILKDVKSGVVDVLIGTHRLLQKDIKFKDLGLLIVDEEQRFGVMHKEKIKNMRENIDVLTLTATPIPRTLHMSLTGIRDISVIEEPPEERYPVQTYVMERNTEVIREAITRELARNGQVFYLYNRVRSISVKAMEIQHLVPDARIGTAHGQMNENELEDIMLRFINGEYDVLVCTTIIESGLDMPNVNTIIVEDADKMGLAQLYQLRGRVGRSNRLAYAYITYKKDKVLTEIAEKRLTAIKEFTEFGSGFKIAMRDLQIRGAGNLLGARQHGHIDMVGYDMYCKLLSEAVNELRGEPLKDPDMEIAIDINVSAYIDNDYIGNENQKIEMYKRIASIQDEQDVLDVEDELIDRYGDIPGSVNNLIRIAYIKAIARECGFMSIQEKGDCVMLQFMDSVNINFEIIGTLMDKYKRKLLFTASSKPYLTFRISDIKREELLENIKILLQNIKKLKSGLQSNII
jgi:transcription-repair coupling factor (superfamily II helicase)